MQANMSTQTDGHITNRFDQTCCSTAFDFPFPSAQRIEADPTRFPEPI